MTLYAYIDTALDEEYLEAIKKALTEEQFLAQQMTEILTGIGEGTTEVSPEKILKINSQIESLSDSFSKLQEIHARVASIAQRAIDLGQSLQGYAPEQILARAQASHVAYQYTASALLGDISLAGKTRADLLLSDTVSKSLGVLGDSIGPISDAIQLYQKIRAGDTYGAISTGISAQLSLVLFALETAVVGSYRWPVVVGYGVLSGAFTAAVGAVIETALQRYDILDINELSPDEKDKEGTKKFLDITLLVGVIDSVIYPSEIKAILQSSSGEFGKRIDSFFDSIKSYFDGGEFFYDISEFTKSLRQYVFENHVNYGLINISAMSWDEIYSLASGAGESAQATRYALENLVSFATRETVGTAAVQQKYNREEYSSEYLADRSLFLAGYLEGLRNNKDNIISVEGGLNVLAKFTGSEIAWTAYDSGSVVKVGNRTYTGSYDRDIRFGGEGDDVFDGSAALGEVKSFHLYGDSGNDNLSGGSGGDYLEGGIGNDTLNGNDGNDTLRGMAGNDELTGGKGNDYLEGGASNDTYIFADGFGQDTIGDSDGSGVLKYESILLGGGEKVSDNSFYDAVNGWTYTRIDNDLLLTRTDSSDSIRIVDWQEGKLGIRSTDPLAPSTPVVVSPDILGDLKPIDFDPNQPGVQTQVDSLGNIRTDPRVIEAGRDDVLYDGSGNDRVYGLAGNDTILGPGSGDDLLDGGTGDDFLSTGSGADTVIGGLGSDRVIGGTEDNRLYGDEQLTDAQVIASISTEDGILERGDLLSANSGNDWVSGSVRNDLLLGGSGRDSLYGGGGHDVIYGDGYTAWATPDWTVIRHISEGAAGPLFGIELQNMDLWLADETVDDKDFIFGGAGDDWLFGQNGEDYLEGNTGNDLMYGGKDNDVLVGGDGDDSISGDLSFTPTGQDGDDLLVGGRGNDVLNGDGGNDTLYGGDDDDHLGGDNSSIPGGLHGNDLLDGGSGNDTLLGHGGDDTLDGGLGNDLMFGDDSYHETASEFHGRDLLRGGLGDDSLYGGGNADELYGGDGDDLLAGDASPQNMDIAIHGNDTLYGEKGVDSIYGNGGSDYLDGGADNDFLFGDSSAADDLGDGNDTLIGGSGNDKLYGAGGDDRLQGGTDNDSLAGGSGNDIYVINAGDGADVITDSNGTNVIEFGAGITIDSLSFNKTFNTQLETVLTISYGGSAVSIVGGYSGAISLFRFNDGSEKTLEQLLATNTEGVRLDSPMDGGTLHGTGGRDTLQGAAGNDVLGGNLGNDLIDGGRGNDRLEGGSGDDTLFGAEGDDYLSGGDGDDILTGGTGADTLVGGAGSNEYVFEMGMGNDMVITSEQESVIVRLKSGYELDDIVYRYDQSDLILESKVDGSTLRIKDYLLVQPELNIAVGNVLTPASGFITAEAQSYSQTLESLERGFKAALISDYTKDMVLRDGIYSSYYIFDSRYIHNEETYYFDMKFVDTSSEDGAFGPSTTTVRTSYESYEKTAYQLYMDGDSSRMLPGALASGSQQIVNASVPIGVYVGSNSNVIGISNSLGVPEGWYFFPSTGVWVPEGVPKLITFTISTYQVNHEFNIGHASNSNGYYEIWDSGIFYGGTGNDTIDTFKESVEPGEYPHDKVGMMLSGGEGEDVIYGGNRNDLIIGGVGNDTLYGFNGEDNYVFMAGDGVDVVVDTNFDYGYDYTDWGFEPGWERNAKDTVTLPESVKLEDISLAWGETFVEVKYRDGVLDYVDPYTTKVKEAYTTLDISWGTDQVIRIVMPRADDPQYTGIEFIKFSDGSSITLSDLISGRLELPYPDARDADQTIFNDGYYSKAPMIGGNGNDTIGGNGYLIGRAGDDILQSSSYFNVLIGGVGSDTYEFAYGWGQDTLDNFDTGFDKTDHVVFGDGINVADIEVYQQGDDLLLLHRENYDSLTIKNYYLDDGQSQYRLEQILFADGTVWGYDDVLNWQPPAVNVEIWGSEVDDYLDGATGDDSLYGMGSSDAIRGFEGNDLMEGGDGLDYLQGGDGNDTLVGGSGNDYLWGDGGSDTYRFDRDWGQDVIYNSDPDAGRMDVIDFSADILPEEILVIRVGDQLVLTLAGGTDTITVDNYFYPVDEDDNFTVDEIRFANGVVWTPADVLLMTEDVDDNLVGGAGNDTLSGGGGNDTLSGGAGDDLLLGGSGDDSLIGGPGNDGLDGGTGIDTMVGGAGDDVYVVDNAADVVSELANSGNDAVQSSVSLTLATYIENLVLTGSNAINGTGNTSANRITGNSAANTLNGGAGIDTLIGGDGSDIYIVDNVADVVVESANEGIDTVQSSASYTLGAHLENLTLTGTGLISGTGNDLDNLITGNSSANTLYGGLGNDRLDGLTGSDTMYGGAGDDTYVVNIGTDVVTELAGEGLDTIESSVTYNLGNNLENLTLIGSAASNATGNALDNVLTGNASNNILNGGEGSDSIYGGAGYDRLDGGAGDDLMYGGIGNDTYVVDSASDVIVESAGEGTDLVEASATYSLSENLENLTLVGDQAIGGSGNAQNNVIAGNSAANSLFGGEGNDSLIGGAGNDRLDGGMGKDTLVGGSGDDTYVVDISTDVTTEAVDGGIDTVEASVSHALQANVENLILTGTDALNGTGNSLANLLIGNSAANVLNGGTGSDTLQGGSGNDTYVVDSASDLVIENANEGIDTVQSSVTYTLSANVENLTLTGGVLIDGIGNALGNVLVGNWVANTLSGGEGNDTLSGGEGNDRLDGGTGADSMLGGYGSDIFVVDSLDDVVVENVGEGSNDTIESSITLTLGANVENLTLTGSAAINGTGNSLVNILIGNDAANVLLAGADNDTLRGGGGNDWLDGGAGYDLMEGGSGDDYLFGDSGNDRLDGGTGADTLVGGNGDDTFVVDSAGDLVTEAYNAGVDTVESSISYALGDNVENLTLTGGAAINGIGNSVNNRLLGSSGDNLLSGGAGNDRLDGQGGADTLVGGVGNDTYVLGRGYGTDRVVENDATANNKDQAEFAADISIEQLWFRHLNGTNDLEVSVIGTSDALVIQDWYGSNATHIEQFKTSNGKTLLDSQVQSLVDAMASFAPPAPGETTLSENYQAQLSTVIAANWQ